MKSWTDVAQEFGYYDPMRMMNDLVVVTGRTPTCILAEMEAFSRANSGYSIGTGS